MKKASALMFQGTGSNVGKSLMTAAYCRILSNRGYRVAPFKAQNMSLNSAVTQDGREVGRAQALQAAAARVTLVSDMNPVLLKPNSDTGSQVVVNGRVWQNLEALDYYAQRKYLWGQITAAYDRLSSLYDVLVLEGAGSPGEVNLKKQDMVNMSMARYAESSVILVGDIDRGGVYASFIGHYTVMEEWERKLLKAFLVNKFRGDASLLEDAHVYTEKFTGKPVAGVIPYRKDHRLPEEDGVDFQERYGSARASSLTEEEILTIGILQLPHISNSTDLDPLLNYPSCRLKEIREPEDLSGVNLLILPGSKNVISDLQYLKTKGISQEVIQRHRAGKLCLLGICGGYQMLGRSIEDSLGIEFSGGRVEEGLNLLPLTTALARDKSLILTSVKCLLTSTEVEGYEIHHGKTTGGRELFETTGLGSYGPGIWGSYLHGILENDSFTEKILQETVTFLKLPPRSLSSGKGDLDRAIDNFAALFEESVDLDFLLKATGL